MDSSSFLSFWVQYGDFVKLALIFVSIIVLLKFKIPLSGAIGAGSVLTVLLYGIPILDALLITGQSMISEATIMVILNCYLITFLQRMMELRGHLDLAQRSLSRLFNSRRVNASIAPVFIGLLPSPGAIFIAGSMVDAACGDYISKEDKTFVASFFRHIPESFLPTYSSIILACQLTGVQMGAFVLGMVPMVACLLLLGYLFYLRRVPKDTGEPPTTDKLADLQSLCRSLWTIAVIILLIIAFNVPVYLATIGVIIVYFFTSHFTWWEIKPFFLSALEARIVINTFVVMIFKDLLTHTNVITALPGLFEALPIPSFLIFGLIFFVGTIVAGSTAIITLCLPMAFTAIPGAGMPLMVFLMSCTYTAMQISPTHLCLTLACEHFKTDFGALVKRTLPVIGIFYLILTGYYLLLNMAF
ncbi:MAG: DUF401 family protein [Oscillospiraceae bacterium]|nr:DUF401 family protein [Oscillospiraceae bacterium]